MPRVKGKDWIGKKVRLLRTLRTKGGAVFKRNRVMVVRNLWAQRFSLVTFRKKRDGLRGWITRVSPEDVVRI